MASVEQSLPQVTVVRPGRLMGALMFPLSRNTEVTALFSSSEGLKSFQNSRELVNYHPGIKLPDSILATDNVKRAIAGADIIFMAPPMKYLRTTCKSLKPYGIEDKIVAVGTKGLEVHTSYRPSEVVHDVIPRLSKVSYAAISGPNIAREIAREKYAVTVIASDSDETNKIVQAVLKSPFLHAYLSNDIIGVELGGALKNLVAMGVGISDGLGQESNAGAAIQNKGLLEMYRIVWVAGGNGETIIGQAGEGDLTASCKPRGAGGRNRDAGEDIGRGVDPRVLQKSGQTIEAFNTVGPALALVEKLGVEAPLIRTLHKILNREVAPNAILGLLTNGNHYEYPEPIIHRRFMKRLIRGIQRWTHLWRNAS